MKQEGTAKITAGKRSSASLEIRPITLRAILSNFLRIALQQPLN